MAALFAEMRGYESKAEEIMAYSYANGPHKWSTVRDELSGDMDADEFPLLAELLGFSDEELSHEVSFNDWAKMFKRGVDLGHLNAAKMPTLRKYNPTASFSSSSSSYQQPPSVPNSNTLYHTGLEFTPPDEHNYRYNQYPKPKYPDMHYPERMAACLEPPKAGDFNGSWYVTEQILGGYSKEIRVSGNSFKFEGIESIDLQYRAHGNGFTEEFRIVNRNGVYTINWSNGTVQKCAGWCAKGIKWTTNNPKCKVIVWESRNEGEWEYKVRQWYKHGKEAAKLGYVKYLRSQLAKFQLQVTEKRSNGWLVTRTNAPQPMEFNWCTKSGSSMGTHVSEALEFEKQIRDDVDAQSFDLDNYSIQDLSGIHIRGTPKWKSVSEIDSSALSSYMYCIEGIHNGLTGCNECFNWNKAWESDYKFASHCQRYGNEFWWFLPPAQREYLLSKVVRELEEKYGGSDVGKAAAGFLGNEPSNEPLPSSVW
eukprot:g2768.t1